jgi:glycosyltransferase involved in cell wall biosynthesis
MPPSFLYLTGGDAIVLPTRGEGWGRPQMEAMSLGRPLITTNWSGPTAYINHKVAYPLAFEGLSNAAEGECQPHAR